MISLTALAKPFSKTVFVCALLASSLAQCAAYARELDAEERKLAENPTSLVAVLATPDRFAHRIGLQGVFRTSNGQNWLYLSSDDADYVCQSNSIKVVFENKDFALLPASTKNLEEVDYKRVTVTGLFHPATRTLRATSISVLERKHGLFLRR
jgi:hypothetical protein